jgi:type I restriction enzyme S subunit
MNKSYKLNEILTVLTDYHANGAYKKLKENVELKDEPNYAVMIRTTNFEQDNFQDFKYVDQHAYEFLAKSKVYPDDILMNKIANAGSSYLMPDIGKPVSLAMNLFLLRVNEDLADSCYVYLWLKVNEKYVKGFANGTTTKTITKDSVNNLDISLPDLVVQKLIASKYRTYQKMLENNNRRIDILEEMAQSLYREWFVNFRYPGHANQPDGSSDNKDSKPNLIDSPLGPIPEGWEVKSLGDLVHFKRNTIKKGTIPELTPYMGLEHFPRKSIALSEWEEVGEIGSNKLAFNRGDILFGKIRPNFHKVGVAQVNGLCSSDTFVLSPKLSVHHSMISMVTFSDEFVAQAVQTSQGSKMPRASWDVLKDFPVYIPELSLLEQFNAVVEPAIEQVRILSLKNRNLKKQRDMLLPKLISGQIQLKD